MGKFVHGHSKRATKAPEYRVWTGIVTRCYNQKSKGFAYYGARGITMAPEWRHDFQAFFDHVGPKPAEGYSIDRIDNSRGYEPGNVRWSSMREQCRNRRSNHILTINGESAPIIVWLERIGVSYGSYKSRIKKGWSEERSATTPIVPARERRMFSVRQGKRDSSSE